MVTTTTRGLGKGLSALISENYVQPSVSVPKSSTNDVLAGVSILSVKKLHGGKYQPRTQFNESALAELAASVKKNGIMQPIIARPSPQFAGKFEIIAGERRWRAAQLAMIEHVPVIVRDISDQQTLELALVENIQRQDLSPLEESAGYQRLIEEFDYTQEALAETVGKSRSHIANLLRLLSLPDEVKEMLNKGELTMGHARALLNVPDAMALAREIVAKGLNVRQTEDFSRKAQGHEKKPNVRIPGQQSGAAYKAPVHKDPDIIALEATLSENLGLKVSINDRGQAGEIIIAYESLSQLDDILRRLGEGA